jgi:hypothetical protein
MRPILPAPPSRDGQSGWPSARTLDPVRQAVAAPLAHHDGERADLTALRGHRKQLRRSGIEVSEQPGERTER